MGRHRYVPIEGKSEPKNSNTVGSDSAKPYNPSQVDEAVLDRMGLNDMVCMSCNSRVPRGRDTCRNCGEGKEEFRKKARKFRGKGTDGSNV